MPTVKGLPWAILFQGQIVAYKIAPDQDAAAANYPGCTAVPWLSPDPPPHLLICRHCSSGDTKRLTRQEWYCLNCRRTWSLAHWQNKPELEPVDPTLSREEAIAAYTRQGATQRQIAKMLKISQPLVSKKSRKGVDKP